VADDVRLGRLVEVPVAGPPVVRPITALWRGTARDLSPTSRELVEIAVAEAAEAGDMVHHTSPPARQN
jgi:DNA-binding transcriptional LysR family regulator